MKAHGVHFLEMETAAKPSSQPRTKSCVMSGTGHCEAETGRLQAGTSVNGKIAPKSIVMEVADLIPLTGKAETQDAAWQVSRDASGVRTASMQLKESMGTREIRRVQA